MNLNQGNFYDIRNGLRLSTALLCSLESLEVNWLYRFTNSLQGQYP